jgi:hypothetical protein
MERDTDLNQPSSPTLWKMLCVLWMAILFWLSSRGSVGSIMLISPWKNGVQGLGYLVLGFLLTRASKHPNWAWVVSSWFAAFDEIHQSFAPLKSADFLDWLAALFGGFVGSRLAVVRVAPKPESKPESKPEELNQENPSSQPKD